MSHFRSVSAVASPCLLAVFLVLACARPMPAPRPPVPVTTAKPSRTPAAEERVAPVPQANPLIVEIAAAERAAADHPDDAEVWARLASALKRANRLQEAARAAWCAVELAPAVESWTLLGNVLMQGGAPNGALGAFEEVSRLTSDGFLAAQNFLTLGFRAWQWGMDDLALRAYAHADEVAPGHPLLLYNRALLSAASGKTATAQAEATVLANVVERVLQDHPPLEMVEMLEPMKALTESIMHGDAIARQPPQPEPGQHLPERFWRRDPGQSHALDLTVDPTSERYYPIAGWHVLTLKLPSEWTDSLEVSKGRPARLRLETGGLRPVLWLLTVSENRETPDLDRLVAEAQRSLPGRFVVGPVRPFIARNAQGRTFIADAPAGKPGDYPHACVTVLRTKGFRILSTLFLPSRDPALLDESEHILQAIEVRDLTPPSR